MTGKAAQVGAWDGPTRLFKWTLVVLVCAAPLTKWYGDFTLLQHKLVGYSILTLVLWRVLWGVFGGSTARFSSFVRAPWAAGRYALDLVRGKHRSFLGHNPLGAYMVLALLAVLTVQAVTGLFATDDIVVDGPFRPFVTYATSKFLTGIHDVLPRLLLALVIVHVLANLAYTFLKGENLIGAMVTGKKPARIYEDQVQAAPGSWAVAALLLVVAAGVVFGAVGLLGTSAFR
jgi:cytochrome b